MKIKNLIPSTLRIHAPIDQNKLWYIEYYTHNKLTGHNIRHRKTFNLNRIKDLSLRHDEAHRIMKFLVLVNVKGEILTTKKYYTIKEALDIALDIKKNRTDRKKTIVTYTGIVNIFLRYLAKNKIENIDVKLINRKIAIEFLDNAIYERQISARTHNNYINILKNIFNVMVDREFIETNPFVKIKELRETESIRKALSSYEKSIIMKEIRANKDIWLEIAILFIYYTLIRPIELRRMRFKDVDLQKGLISLSGNQTKNKKHSIITMNKMMINRLFELDFHKFDPNLLIFGTKGKPHFEKPIGEHTLNNRHRRILKKLSKKYNFDNTGISIYSWKDTGATDLLQGGLTIDQLRQHIRHENLRDTQRYLKKFNGINPTIKEMNLYI